jgi:hypothetical protein
LVELKCELIVGIKNRRIDVLKFVEHFAEFFYAPEINGVFQWFETIVELDKQMIDLRAEKFGLELVTSLGVCAKGPEFLGEISGVGIGILDGNQPREHGIISGIAISANCAKLIDEALPRFALDSRAPFDDARARLDCLHKCQKHFHR